MYCQDYKKENAAYVYTIFLVVLNILHLHHILLPSRLIVAVEAIGNSYESIELLFTMHLTQYYESNTLELATSCQR